MEKKLKILILLGINLFNPHLVGAQKTKRELKEILVGNKNINEGIWLTETDLETSSAIFEIGAKNVIIDDNNILKLLEEETDELNITHQTYLQVYKGIEIENCVFKVHFKNRKFSSANGNVELNINSPIETEVTEPQSLKIALSNINAEKYSWQISADSIDSMKIPKGRLVLANLKNNINSTANYFKLVYKFDIQTISPMDRKLVYIDAISGKVLNVKSIIIESLCACCSGNGNTLFNGQQTINTDERGFAHYDYILLDACRRITTKDKKGVSHNYADTDNDWTETSDKPAVSAHWAIEKTYDYFLNTFSRNSFDNNGAEVWIWMNENSRGEDNAFWNGTIIGIGDGTGGHLSNPAVSLDALGHELTHAVTEKEGNLTFENESGALNESFSDIFGTMVEFSVEGNSGDYLIGEDFFVQDGYARNMSNPNSKTGSDNTPHCPTGKTNKQPNTYKGNYWLDYLTSPNCDKGGIHTNSGVQNYWFYLLAEGGSGTNDNGIAYNVLGIGKDKAAAIAYRNLTEYITSSSSYPDSKNGSIFSAIDLYGVCSNEVIQTINAWKAVGVNSSLGFDYNISIDCNDLSQTSTQRAIGYLTANCSIPSNANSVIFTAGNLVTLEPGFETFTGSDFEANIEACISNARHSTLITSSSSESSLIEINKTNYLADKEETIQSITIYPNPTNSKITLTIPNKENAVVFFTNMLGQSVMLEQTNTQSIEFNISHLPKGIYFVTAKTATQQFVSKLVKE